MTAEHIKLFCYALVTIIALLKIIFYPGKDRNGIMGWAVACLLALAGLLTTIENLTT